MGDTIVYNKASIYIDDAASLQEKIQRVDAIITALETLALESTDTDNITEYSLDSGQTKIKTQYRGLSSIYTSINNYIKLKTLYINKLNGRSIKLLDGNNFRRRC